VRGTPIGDEKPDFVKDLSKVWRAFSAYSAANTVMAENNSEHIPEHLHANLLQVPTFDICADPKAYAFDDTIPRLSEYLEKIYRGCSIGCP